MGNISAQTNFRISAKPKIRVLDRFEEQDLKIGSFVILEFQRPYGPLKILAPAVGMLALLALEEKGPIEWTNFVFFGIENLT